MKKNRFAKLLLTGKAASLPLLISQVKAADVTPTYSEMIGSELRIIQVPLGNAALRLQSITADSNDTYGTPYAAFFCSNQLSGMDTNTTFVVTGLTKGDTVYLAAASDKNYAGHTSIDRRLTLGAKNVQILGSATVDSTGGGTLGNATVSFIAQSSTLQQLGASGRFYLQALVLPRGIAAPSGWKYSELDEVVVGNCVTDAYGTRVY